MPISTYSRYVLREITSRMAIGLVIALLALLAERLLRIVNLVTAWRGSVLMVFEMLGYLVPHYLRIALPATFFLGIFLTFRRLSRDRELDAMMACGHGLHQSLRPVYGVALVLLVVQASVVGYAEPLTRYGYRAGVHAVTSAAVNRLLQNGGFVTLGRTTYLAEEISSDRRTLTKVFIHSEGPGGSSIASTARAGAIEAASSMEPLRLKLFDGLHQLLASAPAPGQNRPPPSAAVMRFQTFQTEVGAPEPVAFRARGEDHRELTLVELWSQLDAPTAHLEKGALVAEFHGQLIRTLSILILPLLAMPLALGPRRPQRPYRLIAGIVVLVTFHEVIQFGERMIAAQRLGPATGLWLPFGLFALAFLGVFLRTAVRVPDRAGSSLAEGVAGWFRSTLSFPQSPRRG